MLGRLSWYWKTNRLGPDMLSTYPLLFFPGCMRWVCRKKFRHFGEGAEFRPGAFATETQAISIGANVIIRQGTNIHASPYPQGSIDIEDDVLLGPGVHFYADNHVFADPARPIVDQGFDTAPVRVCKGAWLGSNVVVLAGVTIGEHAVVGAGSIVTKDVPAWTLAVGNPARVIRDIR